MERVTHLIERLGLEPHPEGGFYRQIFRSSIEVVPQDGRDRRPALTTIYFLLPKRAHSRWHRVRSDEVWHFYEGAPLELWQLSAHLDRLERIRLGPLGDEARPTHVVPAHRWQAARSTGEYTLVGCSVGPGFVFDDFDMMRKGSAEAVRMSEQWPDAAMLL
jgi:predicted cupin superfamily sugar epimerase